MEAFDASSNEISLPKMFGKSFQTQRTFHQRPQRQSYLIDSPKIIVLNLS